MCSQAPISCRYFTDAGVRELQRFEYDVGVGFWSLVLARSWLSMRATLRFEVDREAPEDIYEFGSPIGAITISYASLLTSLTQPDLPQRRLRRIYPVVQLVVELWRQMYAHTEYFEAG